VLLSVDVVDKEGWEPEGSIAVHNDNMIVLREIFRAVV
jgi:hypothetical protein